MKKTLIAAAILMASIASWADTTVGSTNDNSAGAINSGVNLNASFYSPGQLPFTSSYGRIEQDTNQAHSAASSFATSAVWRCATSGTGFALQGVGGGLSYAGKGGEAPICVLGYRMALVEGLYKAKPGEEQVAQQKLACLDDDIADALEGSRLQCPAPNPNARKDRWAREQEARRVSAVLNDAPAAPIQAARPMPWQAGG